jgi:hypothetical protein
MFDPFVSTSEGVDFALDSASAGNSGCDVLCAAIANERPSDSSRSSPVVNVLLGRYPSARARDLMSIRSKDRHRNPTANRSIHSTNKPIAVPRRTSPSVGIFKFLQKGPNVVLQRCLPSTLRWHVEDGP